MEALWILVLVVVAIVVLVVVWRPLFGKQEPWELPSGSQLDRLLAEKARVLRALKDLEQEKSRGLIGEQEFAEARSEYIDKAAGLNRAIAVATGVDPAAAEEKDRDAERAPAPAPAKDTERVS